MFRTVFPQEAIGRAHHLTVAYQSAQVGLSQIAAEFRDNLGPVVDRLGEGAVPYLREVSGRIRGHAEEAASSHLLLPDQVTDPLKDRLIVASRALLAALDEEARAKGLTI